MQREPQNLLQDGTGDKPADVLFGSFYHGRDLCVDVTIVNPGKQSVVIGYAPLRGSKQNFQIGLCPYKHVP